MIMFHHMLTWLSENFSWLTVLGLGGQLLFTARFLIQWFASERAGKSVIPEAFWYCSIFGGLIVFAYGVAKLEPVIMLGQGPGIVIYTRNLYFIHREKKRAVIVA